MRIQSGTIMKTDRSTMNRLQIDFACNSSTSFCSNTFSSHGSCSIKKESSSNLQVRTVSSSRKSNDDVRLRAAILGVWISIVEERTKDAGETTFTQKCKLSASSTTAVENSSCSPCPLFTTCAYSARNLQAGKRC